MKKNNSPIMIAVFPVLLLLILSCSLSSSKTASQKEGAVAPGGNLPSVSRAGKIVFERWCQLEPNPEIMIINADGTDEKKLGVGESPTVSPDGKKIFYLVYNRSENNNLEMHIMGIDGTNDSEVNLDPSIGIDTSGVRDPAWSPDGKSIAFNANFGDYLKSDIFIMSLDGSEVVNVTKNPRDYGGITWSPDSQQIAFDLRSQGAGALIYSINVDGTGLKQISTEYGMYPSWSPDGKRIAFQGEGCIPIINSDGSKLINHEPVVNIHGAACLRPKWSPDSTAIVFLFVLSANADSSQLFIMNADNSNRVQITNTSTCSDDYPVWIP